MSSSYSWPCFFSTTDQILLWLQHASQISAIEYDSQIFPAIFSLVCVPAFSISVQFPAGWLWQCLYANALTIIADFLFFCKYTMVCIFHMFGVLHNKNKKLCEFNGFNNLPTLVHLWPDLELLNSLCRHRFSLQISVSKKHCAVKLGRMFQLSSHFDIFMWLGSFEIFMWLCSHIKFYWSKSIWWISNPPMSSGILMHFHNVSVKFTSTFWGKVVLVANVCCIAIKEILLMFNLVKKWVFVHDLAWIYELL